MERELLSFNQAATSQISPDVLLVEDDELFVEVLETCFQRQGVHYRIARDGAAAVEMAYRYRPRTVLLDIKLPKQSGFLVAAKLKSLADPPRIIILTALPRGACDRLAKFVGADQVFHKPVAIDQILKSLRDMPPRRHAA